MSLVICSNSIADGTAERQNQSIYKAWSFRNQLTSTYKIPANAQVALQSVKVNVDGRIVLSRQNNVFYQYFGKKLNLDGATAPQIEDTPYHPLRVALLRRTEVDTSVKEFTLSDFANRVGERMSDSIYHPNLQDKTKVEILRNASGLDFLGYKITQDQYLSASNVNGSLVNAEEQIDADKPRNGSGSWTYTSGTKVFQRNASLEEIFTASAIFPDNPLSLSDGTMIVNISGNGADANASGSAVPWAVGLSRYFNNGNMDGFYAPYYNDDSYDADLELGESGYMDFGVARNDDGDLVAFHTAFDSAAQKTRRYEINYWENASSSFTALSDRLELSNGKYEKVRFTAKGETLKADIYNASTSKWETITEYSGAATAANKDSQFNPIHQACWCLHPVLEVGSAGGTNNKKLHIAHIKTPPILDYDVKKKNKSGWWETMDLLGTQRWCRAVESRAILDTSNTNALYTQVGVDSGASNRITGLNNVLILEPSEIYTPSRGANARQSLGFNSGVIDTPDSLNPTEFHSNFAPSLVSSQAMFVRLDNFNQRVVNALTGNKSQIIGHLPRFDSTQSTGRLYFEPNNFVWIDLDNPSEISVSDFNISFCYSNEQYATILTGQSIVVLYFRSKPKELM